MNRLFLWALLLPLLCSSALGAQSTQTWATPCTLDVVFVAFRDTTAKRDTSVTYNYYNYDQPYNPANPAIALRFTLPEAMHVELQIYNVLGQKVRTLVPFGPWLAGEHSVVWDGKNSQGRSVSTGVYVVKLRAGEQVKNRKVLILR